MRQLMPALALLLASAAFGQVRIVIISADGTRRDAVLVGVSVDTTKSPWQIRPAAPVYSVRRLTRDATTGAWTFPAGLTLVLVGRGGLFMSGADYIQAGNSVTLPGSQAADIVAGLFVGTPDPPPAP